MIVKKVGKFNFSPRNVYSKKDYLKKDKIYQEEIKKKLTQNNIRKIEITKKHNKSNDDNNNYLTDKVSNDNFINSESNDISQILTQYFDEIQNKNNNKNINSSNEEENSNTQEKINKINNKENYDNIETCTNSSELKILISTNKKEKIDFISTYLKLKGIQMEGNNKRKVKYLHSFDNNKNNSKNNNIKNDEKNKNQKNIIINKFSNSENSKITNIRKIKEINLTEDIENKREYSPINYNKKLLDKSKNKDKINYSKSFINKTISSKGRNHINEVKIIFMDSSKKNMKNTQSLKTVEKPTDFMTNKKNKLSFVNNNKKNIDKIKNVKKNSLKNIYKNGYKNSRNIDTNNEEKENEKRKNDKKTYSHEKGGKKIINSIGKKNNDDNYNKNKSVKNKRNDRSKEKKDVKEKKEIKENKEVKERKENKENKERKENKEKMKHFKVFGGGIHRNNFRNYDSRKLKRVQNQKFSVIDELDEEVKGNTFNNNKKKLNYNNKKENENNHHENTISGIMKETNDANPNTCGIRNNNNSILTNETFLNDFAFSDKKNLLNSFFSTSTFNNDIVNYKPHEKNGSYLLNNKDNNTNNINNLTNTNFSIINNSNLNNENTNSKKILTTQANNNNISKNNNKFVGSISDIIHLNPENEEKTNFQIENNSNIINEIDSNNISEIMPVENKEIAIDYKINVYDNTKLKKDLINDSNEISSNISLIDDDEESIVNQFDIIDNQRQNETKEIKLSQIINKETINDNKNNNVNNSNANISIVNLSKLTNFVDSNIKFGDISHISNKVNIKNTELRKNSKNMEIILESDNNSNNNTSENETNKKSKKNMEQITIKNMRYTNYEDNNDDINVLTKKDKSKNIKNEENEKFFNNKNIEKSEIKNEKKIEKEPKDSIRNLEPKDSYRNKKDIININNNKERNNLTKISYTNILRKNSIFEDEDTSPTNKLLNKNDKDIVNIESVKKTNINNEYNNIAKMSINKNLSDVSLFNQNLFCSPPCPSIKINNMNLGDLPKKNYQKENIINIDKNINIENINIKNKIEFNNIKIITRGSYNNYKKNNNTNEFKSKTLKNNEEKYINEIEKTNTPQNNFNYNRFYISHSPPPNHNINRINSNNYFMNKVNENNSNYYMSNKKNDCITKNKSFINTQNIINNNLDKNLNEQRNFVFKKNQILYNISPLNINTKNNKKIGENYQSNQLLPDYEKF